jgi:hypothetical protein
MPGCRSAMSHRKGATPVTRRSGSDTAPRIWGLYNFFVHFVSFIMFVFQPICLWMDGNGMMNE